MLQSYLLSGTILFGVWNQRSRVEGWSCSIHRAKALGWLEGALARAVNRLRLDAELCDALLQPLVLHFQLKKCVEPVDPPVTRIRADVSEDHMGTYIAVFRLGYGWAIAK